MEGKTVMDRLWISFVMKHMTQLQSITNFDGLVAALSRNGKSGVPPALHFQALSTLLTNFADS
eukprot:13310670-Ditylum_brightwellii.AAC.1